MAIRISARQVADALELAIPELASRLPRDVYAALADARAGERHARGCAVLDHLLENAAIAARDGVPICQDTGTVWASIEAGPGVGVDADVFSLADEAVARAYDRARLRKSLVADAVLDRANTGDNTPAFTEVRFVDEPGTARLNIMLKGGGSDNASRLVMLAPGAGRQGIVDEVVRCVREKAANACAPLVIGIGIGSTFDKVAGLAKHALMRPVGSRNPNPDAAALELELLDAANDTGVGPGGLGGVAAALDVHVETAACHIAALPLAVNMGCSALRRLTIDLADANVEAQIDAQLVSRDVGWGHACGTIGAPTVADRAPKRLALPLSRADVADLRAGDACTLTGPLYTLRDAGHMRLLAELEEAGGELPYGLAGQIIFYAGPTPPAAGRPFGAVGPTTASRMDFAACALYEAGVVATVGKGRRDEAVRTSCARTGSVYFTATGGAAALLAQRVSDSSTVAYDDLGPEALRRIEVEDFPVFVGIDAAGTDVYDMD